MQPRTLSEVEKAVAAHITEMSPEAQGHVLGAVSYAFQAGYADCQLAYRQAGEALRKGMSDGVQE